MLTGADHVQPGLQAALSTDIRISQFRFLKQLLLVHGAWSYRHLSKLILCASPKCGLTLQEYRLLHVLIYSQGDHNHPDPHPTKTPLSIRQPLEQWLQSLDWQLADVTPRRILLNPEFLRNLRDFLNWKHAYNPSLSALHPSLENKDHVQ
ncbi:hypothetical protein M422DRAFT_248066 [Sphaerobolus stellatus SS14]|nr:hypothetical protein M422DRAFT_248066 [Sphaerobolus stellatus SS14]